MSIGERILQSAKAAGINQAALAERLGINQATVSLWGKGSVPAADKIPQIADVLGVSVQYLLTGNEPPPSPVPTSPSVPSSPVSDLSALRAEVARLTAELAHQTELTRQLSAYNRLLEARLSDRPDSASSPCGRVAG